MFSAISAAKNCNNQKMKDLPINVLKTKTYHTQDQMTLIKEYIWTNRVVKCLVVTMQLSEDVISTGNSILGAIEHCARLI